MYTAVNRLVFPPGQVNLTLVIFLSCMSCLHHHLHFPFTVTVSVHPGNQLTGLLKGKMKCYGLVDGRRPWPLKGVFGGRSGGLSRYIWSPLKVSPRTIYFRLGPKYVVPRAKYCGSDSEIYCPPLKYNVPHGSKYFNRNISSPLYNTVNYSTVLY